MGEPSQMLAAAFTHGGRFMVGQVPKPRVESDEILLRVRMASICGTDLKIVRSGHRKLAEGQRIVLGHEFVGVIEQVGSDVEGNKVGQ